MGNVALSLNEQIDLLKSRGIDFDGFTINKIKEILLDIGYYRLGFYWFDLRKNNNSHDFNDETKFKTIIDLYYLDNDIRYILIKYLNRIEINFRTALVYYVSLKFKNDSEWFANKDVMESNFVNDFDKHYNEDFKSKHYVIKNHHKNYPECKYAPAWKTLENFPFGSIFKVFQNIKDEPIKERISEKLGIKPIVKFNKTFKGLVQIRNRCAHSAILYNYNLPTSIPTIPSIDYENDNRSNLDVILKTISYILNHISINRKNDFEIEINNCLKKFQDNHSQAYKIFTEKSGVRFF